MRNERHRLNQYSVQNVMNKDNGINIRAVLMTGQKWRRVCWKTFLPADNG
jgi:hypothetical protein